ncbi:Hypothetical_protein [Hexamita inflata]|uniref:Hypothetical_protein n=1 Tax=Hexamita inflata TaxID=28002 RepID=A0AA86PEM5_9EUKA|nr:Hypothetical protein HINF_LOCUS24777 [Hexamita inflata]
MPTRNENIYATFKEIFTAPIEYNVKQNTEWKRKYLYYGYSTISKVEFDNYLSILFIMFINGAKGSAQNNWSKDPIYKNQYITSIGMDYKQWQEVNRCIYFGNSDFIEEFDDRADAQGEDQYEKSDSEPEPDNEYAETEDELEIIISIFWESYQRQLVQLPLIARGTQSNIITLYYIQGVLPRRFSCDNYVFTNFSILSTIIQAG